MAKSDADSAKYLERSALSAALSTPFGENAGKVTIALLVREVS